MDPTPQDIAISDIQFRQRRLQHKIDQLREECAQLDHSIEQIKKDPKPAQTPPPLPTPPKQTVTQTTHAPIQEKKSIPLASETKPDPTPLKEPQSVKPAAEKATASNASPSSSDWELKLGKIWFVRFGIVSLLTGLIFLGNYAYHNWLFAATAPVKLSCFMLISLMLSLGGMLFEKKKQDLRRYGRVITAGGLAAGYYTIYASHFVSSLKVVHSPPLAATLLTLWAGLILVYASWKRSRIISVMAIGLAFYGSVVNPTGWLSLFSALLLSASGIYLLVRHSWTSVGLVTVAAAYISHAFWLGLYPHTSTDTVRLTYLASYWLLFITALALPSCRSIKTSTSKLLASMNNAGAWLLTVYSIPQLLPQDFYGEFSLGFGTLLMLCGTISSTGKLWPKHLTSTFAYQGLFLFTLGIMECYAGHTRFLILAAETCILLAAGIRHDHSTLKGISAIVYLLSLGLCFFGGFPAASIPVYVSLTLLNAAYTILVRQAVHDTPETNNAAVAIIPALFTWIILCFGVFGQLDTSYRTLALMATVLTFLCLHLKVPKLKALVDLTLVTPLPLMIGGFWQLTQPTNSYPLTYLTLGAFLAFWFLSPVIHRLAKETLGYYSMLPPAKDSPIGWVSGILTCVVCYGTLYTLHGALISRAIFPCIMAFTAHLISERSGRRSLSIPALFGIVASLLTLIYQSDLIGRVGLLVPAIIGLHLMVADRWLKSLDLKWLRTTLATSMTLTLVPLHGHLTHPYYAFIILAVVFYLWANKRQDLPFLTLGTYLPLAVAQILNAPYYGDSALSTYLCLGFALLIHPLTRGLPKPWKSLHTLSTVFTLLLLFLAASCDVANAYNGHGLSITWTLLAFIIFSLGLVSKFRIYRYTGLLWLSLAALYVICIDVMRFDTLGRILSFIVLGLTLIALGYLYNRFQEHIKKLL
ncbi:Predicted membrane protein [Rubritalea squalenifaciens DSM 18772]|uniref:Predicted membrane protein n=1 Tax=Rubritalea squalenifaciens DSM 18772 TaxID=1123071 RepID=A0A1M6KLK1_9BACT|nr:DUF2339 domain-containing protein [Rubritalea squalenifaciens]SHJ59815.1 Predicted membrane protein [Rubritalea squalenifaciens DSM 18772]